MLGSGGIYLGLCFWCRASSPPICTPPSPGGRAGLAGLVIALTLNYLGVRLAVRGVLTLCGLSAIPFLILSVVIIAKGGQSGNTLSVFDPSQTSINTVFNGILFAILLFVGFEAAASIAEEMHARATDPGRGARDRRGQRPVLPAGLLRGDDRIRKGGARPQRVGEARRTRWVTSRSTTWERG